MQRIDPLLQRQYWDSHYKRGVVIRFWMECDDPNRERRHKFGVVLNKDISEPDALLALATSKVNIYRNPRVAKDVLILQPGSYGWVVVETAINLRQIKSIATFELRRLLDQQQLTFETELSAPDLQGINAKIRASELIDLRLKRRTLPDAV